MPDLIGYLSFKRCTPTTGAGALLRHDVFQPVRVGGKALDACSPVAEIRMPQEQTGPRRRVTAN